MVLGEGLLANGFGRMARGVQFVWMILGISFWGYSLANEGGQSSKVYTYSK